MALETQGSISNTVEFHIATVGVGEVSGTLWQYCYMVSMRLLEDNLRECFPSETSLCHVSLDKALLEKLISRFNMFSAKAFWLFSLKGHFLNFPA